MEVSSVEIKMGNCCVMSDYVTLTGIDFKGRY